VYGWPDVLGLDKHDAIIAGQPRTQEWIAAYGLAAFLLRFAVTTFRSFWGQFGWMGVVMDGRVYWALLAFSLFVLAGSGLAVRRGGRWAQTQRDGLAILSFSGLLTVALYLYYNLTLVQHQGRYLFPALIPLAVWAALGLHAWAHLAGGEWRRTDGEKHTADDNAIALGDRPSAISHRLSAISEWLPLGAAGLLAALDIVALYRFLLPGLPRF
jgi:hypothetical protein